MKETPWAVRMALTTFRPVFWLLPGEFRRRNVGEIRAVHRELLSEVFRERGAGGLLIRWAQEAIDLATTAACLHLIRADERAHAHGRKTPHHSTDGVRMTQGPGWQRVPRAIGIACAIGATGLGMLYMASAGAPTIYLAINGLALVMGLAAVGLAWTAGQDRHLPGAAVLFLGVVLLATALFGIRVDGAARWVRVGAVTVQVSLILLPVMLVSFARRRDLYSTLGVVVAALALAIQPDRAMAGVLASAVGVLALTTRDPRVLLALVSAATGFATTLLRPDNLPEVPYVDQILYTSFDVGIMAGLAVTGGALLLVVPALLGWRYDPDHGEVYTTFGVIWLGAVVAAALGDYPTPLVGYGGSAVLGYALSLSVIPPKLHHSAVEAHRPMGTHVEPDVNADLPNRVAVGGHRQLRAGLFLVPITGSRHGHNRSEAPIVRTS